MILTTDEELSLNGETAGTIIRRVECVASNFVLNHSRRERSFWMQRRSAQKSSFKRTNACRHKIRKLNGRKSRQKGPIWRRTGNVRFARAGWWRTRARTWDPLMKSQLNRITHTFECDSIGATLAKHPVHVMLMQSLM